MACHQLQDIAAFKDAKTWKSKHLAIDKIWHKFGWHRTMVDDFNCVHE